MAPRRNGEPQTHPHPNPVERAEQAYQVVSYKRNGKTFPWIAEKMGMSVSTAHKLFGIGIKNMAPPGAQDELQIGILQLEQLYADIMADLEATTDPGEKSQLYNSAMKNIEARRRMYGAPDLKISHTIQTEFDAELEQLHRAFDEDQNIRNATRQRRRAAR